MSKFALIGLVVGLLALACMAPASATAYSEPADFGWGNVIQAAATGNVVTIDGKVGHLLFPTDLLDVLAFEWDYAAGKQVNLSFQSQGNMVNGAFVNFNAPITAANIGSINWGYSLDGQGNTTIASANKYWGFAFTKDISCKNEFKCYKVQMEAVPEPGTILAALSVLGPVGFAFRRKRA
jgi:hypothetical protein